MAGHFTCGAWDVFERRSNESRRTVEVTALPIRRPNILQSQRGWQLKILIQWIADLDRKTECISNPMPFDNQDPAN